MNILKIENLKKYYGSGENVVKALDGVNIEAQKGEMVAIVGASGSGKSTLLNLIGALDQPTGGSIEVGGKALADMNRKQLAIFRRRFIGFVFQNYNLLPVLNGYDNITLPATFDGKKGIDHAFVEDIMEVLHIKDQATKMPSQMSGGQQQRFAIARAMVNHPALILADEPTGNLDKKNSLEVMLLFQEICKKYHQSIIFVTHNEELARLCDRIIVFEDGKIKENLS